MPTNLDFLPMVESQKGDRYVFGAEARWSDPDPDYFDCSELIEWAMRGKLGLFFPDGSANQWAYCQQKNTDIATEDAFRTPGALLFKIGVRGQTNHVAVSVGDGIQTFEARSSKFGVNYFKIANRVWTGAAKIPGLDYIKVPRGRAVDKRDELIHDSVARQETILTEIFQAQGWQMKDTPNTKPKDMIMQTQEAVARNETNLAILRSQLKG